MNLYETIVVIRPDLSEEAIKDLIAKYTRLIKELSSGKPIKVDSWGEKEFAYPLRNYKSGFYVVFTHYASEAGLTHLHGLFELDDGITLKYTSIRQTEEAIFKTDWDIQDESEQYPKTVDALDVALGLTKYQKEVKT